MEVTQALAELDEALAYMQGCTNKQLDNIVANETERSRRGGSVGQTAAIMRKAAQLEMTKRGLDRG